MRNSFFTFKLYLLPYRINTKVYMELALSNSEYLADAQVLSRSWLWEAYYISGSHTTLSYNLQCLNWSLQAYVLWLLASQAAAALHINHVSNQGHLRHIC